jgi:hypothetical protein
MFKRWASSACWRNVSEASSLESSGGSAEGKPGDSTTADCSKGWTPAEAMQISASAANWKKTTPLWMSAHQTAVTEKTGGTSVDDQINQWRKQ